MESSRVGNREEVVLAAQLLRMDPAQLEENICSRLMEIRGCEPTRIPLTLEQASDARNALAKVIF